MSRSRKFFTVGALGIGAMALIGTGATATFTTSTNSNQTINAGTIGMSVWAPGNAGCPDASWKCDSITLPAVGPVASTFETPATKVYITNTGDTPTYYDAVQITETHGVSNASPYLRNQMNVCIKGWDPETGIPAGGWVEGNGPLTTAISLVPTVKENPIKLMPGETNWYSVNFYAGQDATLCGQKYSDGGNTTAAWKAATGNADYSTPASLTNLAMGGVVTPTLTWSFTG